MIKEPKKICFIFHPPTMLPEKIGMKLALFEIFDGDNKPIIEYGFTEWDGTVFGLPDPPIEGYIISLYGWAETVDPLYEAPKIIRLPR